MDAEIKSKMITRVKENPYLNHLGIEFTSVEEMLRGALAVLGAQRGF